MMHKQNHQPLINKLFCATIIVLLSAVTYKILTFIDRHHFDSIVEAAYSVIDGVTWRAYQNRLLGPYTAYAISLLGISYTSALKIYIFALLVLQNSVLFILLRKTALSTQQSFGWLTLYTLVFLFLQKPWFYAWDSIDLIVFTLFAYGIFKTKGTTYFIGLFLIGLMNRESALFIALYIIIDAFYFNPIYKPQLQSSKKLLIGIVLLISGALYTKIIRDTLFTKEPNAFLDLPNKLIGNHIYLFRNLQDLFVTNLSNGNIVNSIFILLSSLYFLSFFKQKSQQTTKALFIYFIILGSTLTFGLVNETRVYLILLPLMIFLHVNKNNQPAIKPVTPR